MKKLIFSFLALNMILFSCSTNERPNGWYLITDAATMTLDKTPIITVSGFDDVKLDSVQQPAIADLFPGQVIFQITGKIKADKVKKFADATEKAIDKQIGFLYNGEVISAPRINQRIDGGHFSITPPFMNDRDKMMQLYEDLKKGMK